MNTIWCPYTGRQWNNSVEFINIEHIIPLSLGGHNSLTIKVNKNENSRIGSELDSKITNSPIISSARRHLNLRGHKRDRPKVQWTAACNGLNGRLDLTPNTPNFSAFRSKNDYGINISKDLANGEKLSAQFNFDLNLILSFGCKLALGASYFLFGDVFKDHGHHDELRKLMNSKKAYDDLLFKYTQNKGKGFWGLNWPKSINNSSLFPPFFDAICKEQEKHLIFTFHTNREIILCISLFSGFYKWFFNIAKDASMYPIKDKFDVGTTIEIDIKEKKYTHISLREYLENYMLEINPIKT